MGCCESTTRQASVPPLPPLPATEQAKAAMEVEEKVKEVLCETPAASRPKLTPPPVKPTTQEPPPPKKIAQVQAAAPFLSKKSMSVLEQVPDAGELRRATNSVPSGGQAAAKQRAERSPVKPRPSRARSLSGDLSSGESRTCPGKSPTRIRPDGIGGSVRIVQGKEASWAHGLDPGERSGRRSGPGSPAKRSSIGGASTRSGVDRTPSMRKIDLSPGRVRRDPNSISKRSTNGGDSKQRQSKGRESLESPLVSLECFIFL